MVSRIKSKNNFKYISKRIRRIGSFYKERSWIKISIPLSQEIPRRPKLSSLESKKLRSYNITKKFQKPSIPTPSRTRIAEIRTRRNFFNYKKLNLLIRYTFLALLSITYRISDRLRPPYESRCARDFKNFSSVDWRE